jgi:hypothetical protein
MNLRFVANLALSSAMASAIACSAGGDPSSKTNTGPNNGTGGDQPVLNTNGGGPILNTSGAGALPMDPNDPRNVPVRQKTCDASGQNCTCLRLALVGTLDSSANAKDTKPFIDWLNGNSDGSAKVTMVATKPTMDAAFLANYDILVVANVNGWAFSAEEKAAVVTWVKEGGGGIITLTGFSSTATEAAATSQLVEFAGMGYSGGGMTDWTAPATGNTTPIHYKNGAADLRNCLNLWSLPADKEASQTTAIKFTPQTDKLEKLTASLDYVGAYIGWPVNAPAGSTVIATDPMTGKNMAVALEVEGKGRILSFGDEWIVFTNQWQPTGTFTDMRMDASNPCWQAPAGTTPSFFQSVKSLYQTKQFWYNMINWVAPPSECNFTIMDPDVVVK